MGQQAREWLAKAVSEALCPTEAFLSSVPDWAERLDFELLRRMVSEDLNARRRASSIVAQRQAILLHKYGRVPADPIRSLLELSKLAPEERNPKDAPDNDVVSRLLAAVFHLRPGAEVIRLHMARIVSRLIGSGLLSAPDGESTLLVDLGSGTGTLVEALAECADRIRPGSLEYLAVDMDPQRLELCGRLCRDVEDLYVQRIVFHHSQCLRLDSGCQARPLRRVGNPVRVILFSFNFDREVSRQAHDTLAAESNAEEWRAAYLAFASPWKPVPLYVAQSHSFAGKPNKPHKVRPQACLAEYVERQRGVLLFPCPYPGQGCPRRPAGSGIRTREFGAKPSRTDFPFCLAEDESNVDLLFSLRVLEPGVPLKQQENWTEIKLTDGHRVRFACAGVASFSNPEEAEICRVQA